jgi:hypothetical protein
MRLSVPLFYASTAQRLGATVPRAAGPGGTDGGPESIHPLHVEHCRAHRVWLLGERVRVPSFRFGYFAHLQGQAHGREPQLYRGEINGG